MPPDDPHHAALRLEYDGTPYHGWTRQPDGLRTVEGDLLEAFATLGCSDVHLRCAGRTDAGVHASAQVVDARYRGSVPPVALARALTGNLPYEVAVPESVVAPVGFDARADATSRAYEYRLLTRAPRSPLRARCTFHHPRRLDRDVLDAAAAAVLGQHRFTAFTPSRTAHTYFDRRVLESRWEERGDELVYAVRGTSFLRHMVRILVGTMLATARGEASVPEFAAMLAGAPRSAAFATAPPQGLCLVDVTWEPIEGVPTPPGWRGERTPDSRDAHPFPSVG
ncbi:MAG: tRNA pseudouridine synthase [Thermoleophilia bacterium]|nr:tRNA pseudouridine synthase [Thermoleophilia bacterium]